MFNRRKRVTKYYVIEKQRDAIFVSHTPRGLLYFADKEKFFAERNKAYVKIAELLRDDQFWKSTQRVTSRSFTIDFSRELADTELVKLKWYDKPGIVMLWLFNLYNWRFSRLARLKDFLFARRVLRYHVERHTFIRAYEGRG